MRYYMYKQPSKQRLLIQRIVVSILASLVVVFAVIVTIFFMLGYRLESGSLAQGALLQFDSSPNGADVWVDGAFVSGRTATKQTVVSGLHSVRMTKSGYEDWNRTLELAAGTLTWLDYIRLVPVNRPAQAVLSFSQLHDVVFSPQGQFALAQEAISVPDFRLIDLRSETVTDSRLTVSSELISDATTEGVTHTYSIESWNTGGRYVLIKHTYNTATEWLSLDTQDRANDKNISQLLGIGLRSVTYSGTNGTQFYALADDNTIRKLDSNARTISAVLVPNVESFSLYDSTIISFVSRTPEQSGSKQAGVYRDGDQAPHLLRTGVPEANTLLITTTRYAGDTYVAIAESQEVTILKGSYPTSSDEDASSLKPQASMQLDAAVEKLSFSPEGDFLLMQARDSFKSYELEHQRSASGSVATLEDGSQDTLYWLDLAHLWNTGTGALTMRDFNGLNAHTIMKSAPGYAASLSQNDRYFYGIGQSDFGYSLQRVLLIL